MRKQGAKSPELLPLKETYNFSLYKPAAIPQKQVNLKILSTVKRHKELQKMGNSDVKMKLKEREAAWRDSSLQNYAEQRQKPSFQSEPA